MKPKKSPAHDLESLALFHVALDIGADGKLPTEFRLFSAGLNKTKKGTFLLDAEACASIAAASQAWDVDHVIDYGHASLHSLFADPAEAGKAAGWFKPAVRDGALWATGVTWTDAAAAKLAAREYRYISPACNFKKLEDGQLRLTELVNAALTNIPATIGAPALVASIASDVEPQEVPTMKSLLVLLGLAESAAESDAVVAVTALKDGVRSILTLSGKATISDAVGVITGWKTGAEQAVALSAKLGEMEKASAAREIDTIIGDAMRDGRLPPAHEKTAREVGATSLSALTAMLSVLPKIGVPREEPKEGEKGAPGSTAPTAEDRQVSAMLGIDPTKVAQMRAEKSTAAK